MKRIPFIQGQVELALSLSQAVDPKPSNGQHIVMADIGSDHGYLAQSLLESGIVARAIVTDIAEMPLQNAKNTLGSRQNVEYRLCSGMEGDFSEADIAVIAGMGGDLISEIIRTRGKVKDDILFVLQPMTEWEKVMDCSEICPLWSAFVSERGKYYRVIVAALSNHPRLINRKAALTSNVHNIPVFLEIPYVPNFSTDCSFSEIRTEVVLTANAEHALEHMRFMAKKQISLNAHLLREEDLRKGERRLALLNKAIEILQAFC